jgi:general secretion pathway protein A
VQGWLDERLQAAGYGQALPMNQRVRAFQLAQGLPPDGRAGPITLMRLARPADGSEPRLTAPQALH